MPLPPGATIAGFRVLRLLGEGGMGAVYLVQHPDLPRKDVLKVLHGGMAHQPALRERFEHEARLAAGLNHPNIVQVFDRGLTDDQLWIRMQYVEGTDAQEALAAGPMDPRRVLHIIRSVGSALDYAHRAGLLHRDVKPANILLAAAGHADDAEHVMLTDFGIAKAMDTDVRLTGTGQAFLTPAYSAPERFGTAPIDSRVDVYSLGCVAFELLTGQLPYPHADFLVLMAAHDREAVPDVRALRPELPPGVTRVLRTAMAKDREERYPSCRAFAEALESALRRRDLPPVPPPRPSAPTTVHGTGPGTGPRNPTPVGGWTPESVAAAAPEPTSSDSRGPDVSPDAGGTGRPTGRTVALALAAVILVAAGVTAVMLWPDGEDPTGAAAAVPGPTTVYGTEYNIDDYLTLSFSDPGDLDGVTGIHPGAELTAEFEQRVLGVDPDLPFLDYSGESYDAAVLVALAASMAGSTDAQDFKDVVNGLTFGGEQCDDYASCLAVVEGGDNPNFDGVTGPLDFTPVGEPARATFAVVQFGPDNRIAPAETEFVSAGDPNRVGGVDGPPRQGGAETQEPLVIGTLLPLTGDLQSSGPPAEAGVRLAVEEINAAGGVLGRPVELLTGDSGDLTTDTAERTVDRLLADEVDAIVGAFASSVSLEVLDRVTAAGVLMISPSNTSNELTTAPDDDLYFRVAPPERLQARAIADRIVEDGHDSVGIVAIQSAYGNDMARAVTDDLRAAGIDADDITRVTYPEGEDDFAQQVQRLVDAAPEAVVVFGDTEAADIIAELNAQGIGPAR